MIFCLAIGIWTPPLRNTFFPYNQSLTVCLAVPWRLAPNCFNFLLERTSFSVPLQICFKVFSFEANALRHYITFVQTKHAFIFLAKHGIAVRMLMIQVKFISLFRFFNGEYSQQLPAIILNMHIFCFYEKLNFWVSTKFFEKWSWIY